MQVKNVACRPYHTIALLCYTQPSGILSRQTHCLELACRLYHTINHHSAFGHSQSPDPLSGTCLPTVPHHQPLLGLRAFSVARPTVWNLLADRTTPSPCYVTLGLRAFSVARPTVWNLLADRTTPSTTTRPSGILSRQTHCLELACRPYHTIDLLYYTRPSGILSRRIHCLELAC